jgi:hypothetical protein
MGWMGLFWTQPTDVRGAIEPRQETGDATFKGSVDDGGPGNDDAGAPFGPGSIKVDQPAGIAVVDIGEPIGAHRGHRDSVFRFHPPDPTSFKQLHYLCLHLARKLQRSGRADARESGEKSHRTALDGSIVPIRIFVQCRPWRGEGPPIPRAGGTAGARARLAAPLAQRDRGPAMRRRPPEARSAAGWEPARHRRGGL